MNKQFEQRLRKLEQLQELRSSEKEFLPQWLLDDWHEDTGLPFDTKERALDSIRRMQQPEYCDRPRNTAPAPSIE